MGYNDPLGLRALAHSITTYYIYISLHIYIFATCSQCDANLAWCVRVGPQTGGAHACFGQVQGDADREERRFGDRRRAGRVRVHVARGQDDVLVLARALCRANDARGGPHSHSHAQVAARDPAGGGASQEGGPPLHHRLRGRQRRGQVDQPFQGVQLPAAEQAQRHGTSHPPLNVCSSSSSFSFLLHRCVHDEHSLRQFMWINTIELFKSETTVTLPSLPSRRLSCVPSATTCSRYSSAFVSQNRSLLATPSGPEPWSSCECTRAT